MYSVTTTEITTTAKVIHAEATDIAAEAMAADIHAAAETAEATKYKHNKWDCFDSPIFITIIMIS